MPFRTRTISSPAAQAPAPAASFFRRLHRGRRAASRYFCTMASTAASSRPDSSSTGAVFSASSPEASAASSSVGSSAAGSTPSRAPMVTPKMRLMAMRFSSSGTAASASHLLTA